MIENPTLPAGWTSELVGNGQVLIRGTHGYVTVDWNKRGFRSGFSVYGRLASTAKYVGRGWQQRLVADAVAWLQKVIDS